MRLDTKRQHAEQAINERLGDMNTEKAGELNLIPLKDLHLTVANSRKIKFDPYALLDLIKKNFGEDYDPLELPSFASEFPDLDDIFKCEKNEVEGQRKLVESIIQLAKDYAQQNDLISTIPAINVIRDRNGKLWIQSGNRRFIARLISKKTSIECNKIKNKEDYSDVILLADNLKENVGAEKLSFVEKYSTLHRTFMAYCLEEGVEPVNVKRSKFLDAAKISATQVKNEWSSIKENGVITQLVLEDVITTRDSFEKFKKMNKEEQLEYVSESIKPHLKSLLLSEEENELEELLDNSENTIVRKRKAKSFSVPKIKDPALGKDIISALLKSQEYAHLKDELLEGKRIPKDISEQAELMSRLIELMESQHA